MKTLKYKHQADRWVVLCHGYGADAEDLASLRFQMGVEKSFNWLFPQGELNTPGNEGRAWFMIPPDELRDLKKPESHCLSDTERPSGAKKARESLRREIEKFGVPWDKIVLGGFSQGAMLATDLALSLPTSCAGLVLFSTGSMAPGSWAKRLSVHRGLRLFISHGRRDQIIHLNEAQFVQKLFEDGGLRVQRELFDGEHEIPTPVAYKAGEFIKSL